MIIIAGAGHFWTQTIPFGPIFAICFIVIYTDCFNHYRIMIGKLFRFWHQQIHGKFTLILLDFVECRSTIVFLEIIYWAFEGAQSLFAKPQTTYFNKNRLNFLIFDVCDNGKCSKIFLF